MTVSIKSTIRAGLILCSLLAGNQLFADVTQRDIQVTTRALSFMEDPFKGEVLIGIVFDPANSRSRQQAESIRTMLGEGLAGGSLHLVPEMVPLELAVDAKVDLFFLTEYLGNINTRMHLPCVTVDIDQVRNGNCAMGIQSTPRIEILVNHEAAEAVGTKFASVFRMMIKEI